MIHLCHIADGIKIVFAGSSSISKRLLNGIDNARGFCYAYVCLYVCSTDGLVAENFGM